MIKLNTHVPLLFFSFLNLRYIKGIIGLQVARILADGRITQEALERRAILREMPGLRAADLRRVDPTGVVSREAKPCVFVVDDRLLLLSIYGLRLVVGPEQAFIFEPSREATRQLLDGLRARLTTIRSCSLAAGPAGAHTMLPFELEAGSRRNSGAKRSAGAPAPEPLPRALSPRRRRCWRRRCWSRPGSWERPCSNVRAA